MNWTDDMSPAARERLSRVGAFTEEEKAAIASESDLDDTLRLFFKTELSEDDLFARLKAYEASGSWRLLASARDRLQSSFRAAELHMEFAEHGDGSITVSRIEPQPSPPTTTQDTTVLELTDATFDATIGNHPLLVVDCWAAWCGPCRMVAPVIEELARDYAGRMTFAKLDVDKNRATATRFNIQSIPTILIFKNGKLVDQKMGAMPKAMLEPILAKHLDGGGTPSAPTSA